MEFSIKKCGCLTRLAAPDGAGPADHHPRAVRQSASRWRPNLKGKDLLFIAGGIGLAPLRSVINYVRATTARITGRWTSSTVLAARTIWWTIREILRTNGARKRALTYI